MYSSLNYIKYPGNKTLFLDTLLNLIKSYKDITAFIEPFAGSGTVSLEVTKTSIPIIILNDIDEQVYAIHSAFKYGTYSELNEIIAEIWSYGNPHKNKEHYYKARDEMNVKYFKKSGNKTGFYYWAISIFAINSMMRFGASGFNQGWGARGISQFPGKRKMNKIFFNELQEAYKKIELYNKNYVDLLDLDENNENVMLFVDPPYVDKASGTYGFSEEQQNEFLKTIEAWQGPVIYTDVYSKEHFSKLSKKWNYKILRNNMGVGKPGKPGESVSEAVYFNFPEKKMSISLF